MFTGLVLGMGEVKSIAATAQEARLCLKPLFALRDVSKGESIAVNGVCLTVEDFDQTSFTAYASKETLSRTNLSALRQGRKVNLERALALGDRLGGHLVSGHADGIATIDSITPAASSRIIRVRFPEEYSPQVIAKGSVALDGISLTINHCGNGFLEVNIIPETLAATTAGHWQTGQEINFETDLIGKYVQRMLAPWKKDEPQSRMTLDFLRENGF